MSGRQEFTSTDAAPVILYTKKKAEDKGGYPLHPQYPLPISLDSVYEEDIDETYCTQAGWTGNLVDIFNSLHTGIYNDTSVNPKELLIYFHRTLYLNSVRLGCKSGKDFSNVKLEFLGNDGVVIYTYDDSTDNTKYGNRLYTFVPVACIAIRISFLTADEVGLTSISIQKEFNIAVKNITDNYVASDQIEDGNYTYFGFLTVNGSWYIQRQLVTGGTITWRYAKGDNNYTTALASYSTISYGYFSEIF
jgi:hypothetical protein